MRRKVFRHVTLIGGLLIAAFLFLPTATAQAQAGEGLAQRFTKIEAMIPMRDGMRLNTEIFVPKQMAAPLPFLFTRTPYGIAHDSKGFHPALASSYKELADEGYIFVFQDIRGRFKSEGQFVMTRPVRDKKIPNSIDEGTDTNDTIDWLLKNVPQHNGRVGVLGISYGGWLTVMAMLDPHPAIRAVSPQASPADMFMGDDFHHNGAFRLSYGFEYVAMMETSNTNYTFEFNQYDTYEWYLKLGALSNANERYFKGKLPTWNDFVNHPNYDAFWQKLSLVPHLTRVTVPTLNVLGWWDQEDYAGPWKIYYTLEQHDAKKINYVVAGPWNHGGWAGGQGTNLGKINFDSPTSKYFRTNIQAPFFAYYLKDQGTLPFTEAVTFQTGSNQWQTHAEWPPRRQTTERNLYFHDGGKLSFDAPTTANPQAFDSYLSDPARPVPYRPRPIEPTYYFRGSGWFTWQVEDQRFAHLRPDVLSWETEPLTEDVEVTGNLLAKLFASTTGTDSDWIVKLIDVYPEAYEKEPKMGGYQLMVACEVMRARFRRSFAKPEALVAGKVYEYPISLYDANHRFRKGHKIMVQVQSSWFPVIDRNPQKFVPNIYQANDADYQAATQRIFRSKLYPSHIKLPVVKE